MWKALMDGSQSFWKAHQDFYSKKGISFDEEFKELFMGMVSYDPMNRLTIEEVKKSNFYQGKVFTKEELAGVMDIKYTLRQKLNTIQY